jgi:hypothetical protein
MILSQRQASGTLLDHLLDTQSILPHPTGVLLQPRANVLVVLRPADILVLRPILVDKAISFVLFLIPLFFRPLLIRELFG